eukprot:gene11649-12847_t
MACGTIRTDRKGLPKGLKADRELQQREHDFCISKTGIALYKWKDNEAVHLMSNFHGSDVSSVTRTQKDGTQEEFPCATAVKHYNAHMGGVDKADMLCSFHGFKRKSKKWWRRIFFRVLDCTMVNAYVVYQKLERKNQPALDFHRSVALELLTLPGAPRVGRPGSAPPPDKNRKSKSAEYSVYFIDY